MSLKTIGKNIDTWSPEQWISFIDAQSEHVLASLAPDQQPPTSVSTPFHSITSSSDPRLPRAIDHTLLKPEATLDQIDQLCDEALRYGFKSCCVNSIYAKRVNEKLRGSETIVCCVVGFPLGAGSAQAKAEEAQISIRDGAKEIDMVLPVGLLLSSPPPYAEIYQHLKTVIVACQSLNVPLKVIIETGLLKSAKTKIAACILAAEAGAAFVKTCTGFSVGQATEEDIKLMWHAVREYQDADGAGKVKVKASGGVRTLDSCIRMFQAGAERIGTSSGVALLYEAPSSSLAPVSDSPIY